MTLLSKIDVIVVPNPQKRRRGWCVGALDFEYAAHLSFFLLASVLALIFMLCVSGNPVCSG